MSEDLAELARRGYEAVRRGDFDTVREFLAPEVKWHGGNPADGCQNRKQALAWMQRAGRRGPIGELVDVIAGEDRVVVIMRRIDEDGELELVANLTTFRDGKVVEMVHYENPDDARAAAGV